MENQEVLNLVLTKLEKMENRFDKMEAKVDNSVQACVEVAKTDNSIQACEEIAKVDNSAQACVEVAKIDNSIQACEEIVKVDNSIQASEEVVKTDNSAQTCKESHTLQIPEYIGCCGDNVYYLFYKSTGELIIRGSGKINDCSYLGVHPWHNYKDKINTVNIGDGVTKIGKRAFEGCISLKSVIIPDSVKSIENCAFHGCIGLKEVAILHGKKISPEAFDKNCVVKEYLIIGKEIENKKITDIVSIPKDEIKYVIIEDGVKSIGGKYTFSGCMGLKEVTIPNSVMYIGNDAFLDCTGLISVNIPGSVIYLCSGAFKGCTGLTSITIPDSVTSINRYAFYGCTGLTSITIPDSVKEIGYDAFKGCTGLKEVTVPERVYIFESRLYNTFDKNTTVHRI